MRPELRGLNGGKKQHWLNEHVDEVVAYFHQYGGTATLIEFGMMETTLQRLLERQGILKHRRVRFDKEERALIMAQQAIESNRELRREVKDIKGKFSLFTETVAGQVAFKIMQPLQAALDRAIELPPELESGDGHDPLDLRDLYGEENDDF